MLLTDIMDSKMTFAIHADIHLMVRNFVKTLIHFNTE